MHPQCDIITITHLIIMRLETETRGRGLPALMNKHYSVHAAMQLAKVKKVELERHLDLLEQHKGILPQLPPEQAQEKSQLYFNESEVNKQTIDRLNQTGERKFRSRTIKDPSSPDQMLAELRITHNSSSVHEDYHSIRPHAGALKSRVIRNKTEFAPQENYKRKSITSHVSASTQKSNNTQQEQTAQEEAREELARCLQKIPKHSRDRNEENLSGALKALEEMNPFFRRIERIVSVCLLKVGKIILRDSPTQLFRAGEQPENFYIILAGRVKLHHPTHKRNCYTGQTLLEQILFLQRGQRVALEGGKVVGPTYLLQVNTEEYAKMKEQLIRHGLKQGCHELETIIKRNFIIKNWMRNKTRNNRRK